MTYENFYGLDDHKKHEIVTMDDSHLGIKTKDMGFNLKTRQPYKN